MAVQKHQRRRFGVCVYCGAKGPISRDHVPPKSLFAEPRDHLITVPCCDICNAQSAQDDEYFAWALAMRADTRDHPDASSVLVKMFRALKKPEKQRQRQAFLKSIKEVDVVTDGGLYLGRAGTYHVNNDRLHAVVERTLKGLFYHHYGQRLHDGYAVRVQALAGSMDPSTKAFADLEAAIDSVLKAQPIMFRDGAFAYWTQSVAGDLNSSLWLLVFYQKVAFLGFTSPKTELQHRKNKE